jgi:hypothetical protein
MDALISLRACVPCSGCADKYFEHRNAFPLTELGFAQTRGLVVVVAAPRAYEPLRYSCRSPDGWLASEEVGPMGSNARERHGLYRCGAFVAARVRRPSILNIRGVANILHAESLESFKHQTSNIKRKNRHGTVAKRKESSSVALISQE